MFNKILIANRADQPQRGAATQSNRITLCAAQAGDRLADTNLLAAGADHV